MDEDEHRIALMDRYASHLRYWGTNVLTIAVATFTVLATGVREYLAEIGWLEYGLIFLVAQASYAFLRLIWCGLSLQYVLSACPRERKPSDDTGLWKGQEETQIYLLDQGVLDIIRCKNNRGPRGKWQPLYRTRGELLYGLSGLSTWFLWTICPLAAFYAMRLNPIKPSLIQTAEWLVLSELVAVSYGLVRALAIPKKTSNKSKEQRKSK